MINKKPKINEQSTINNNLEEPKIINNLEEPKINKEITTNNLEELKINDNEKESECKKSPTFVKTPKFLKPKKAILNPHSTDNKSFQDAITLCLYHGRIRRKF